MSYGGHDSGSIQEFFHIFGVYDLGEAFIVSISWRREYRIRSSNVDSKKAAPLLRDFTLPLSGAFVFHHSVLHNVILVRWSVVICADDLSLAALLARCSMAIC